MSKENDGRLTAYLQSARARQLEELEEWLQIPSISTIPAHKRPSAWTASTNGRLALLRKHKNFPRGGTQLEVYDLGLDP